MFDPLTWLLIIVGIIVLIAFLVAASLRTVVPPDKADVVVQGKKRTVFCTHPEYWVKDKKGNPIGNSTYYKIPAWMPGWGMRVRRLPLTMLEIKVPNFVAFDEGRARFECDIVAFVAVQNAVIASMRMPLTIDNMSQQVSQILQATTRESTTKRTVRQTINDRASIINMIRPIFTEAVNDWGLALKDIELVEFKDAPNSHVITDLSAIKEKEINTEMREKNADQDMKARLKEAQTDESAKTREIERDEIVAKREQDKNKLVFEKEKDAKEQELEVTRVQQVKSQKIEKEQREVLAEQEKLVAVIDANKQKEVEAVIKEQKFLEGTGDKLRKEEQAKGEAAPIREMGTAEADVIRLKYLAEAKGKDELQKALNKFSDHALEAYVAKEIVEKDRAIGIAGADALKYAQLRVFSGGTGAQKGFDVGQYLDSITTSNPSAGMSFMNRIAQPNDLGWKKFDYGKLIAVIEGNEELKNKIREEMDKAEEEADKVKEAMDKDDQRDKKIDDFDDFMTGTVYDKKKPKKPKSKRRM